MRPIDADALKQEICKYYMHFSQRLKISPVLEAIKKAPPLETFDVVQIVRCEQCKWWDKEDVHPDGRKRCELLDNIRFEPEFYCAYGERKEG